MRGGRIFCYSHSNYLACLDAKQGKPQWRCSDAELLEAIGSAAKNAAPARSGSFRRIAGAMANREASTASDVPLTPRETQVLRQVALGLSNREIADALDISVETVKEHVQNLLRKIALEDRTQAAVWAIRHGIA